MTSRAFSAYDQNSRFPTMHDFRRRGPIMAGARKLTGGETRSKTITFGVVGTGDPRIDEASRQRAGNIVKTIADLGRRTGPHARRQAGGCGLDAAPGRRRAAGRYRGPSVPRGGRRRRDLHARIPGPFPNSRSSACLAHLPADMPVNITCGNSGPKPGVVYAHAVNGASGAKRPADAPERRHLARYRRRSASRPTRPSRPWSIGPTPP